VPELDVRNMTLADVPAAVAVMDTGEWPGRTAFLEWALANPTIEPLVGELGGQIVATGLGITNGGPKGPIGWVGMIFVDPTLRRRGFGQAITEEVCRRLEAGGCRTLALIASNLGQPVYAQMGFRIDAWYQIWEAPTVDGMPATGVELPAPAGKRLRPMMAHDVDRVGLLDRRATGEDRRGLLASLTGRSWLLEDRDGELLGFLVRQRADGGTTIAADPDDAALLLDLLRKLAHGHGPVARAALVRPPDGEVSPAARELLANHGWAPAFETPRMLRGDPHDWDPSLIWGILGFSFG
jgi:GNAT superfamily N-acetyltransferase